MNRRWFLSTNCMQHFHTFWSQGSAESFDAGKINTSILLCNISFLKGLSRFNEFVEGCLNIFNEISGNLLQAYEFICFFQSAAMTTMSFPFSVIVTQYTLSIDNINQRVFIAIWLIGCWKDSPNFNFNGVFPFIRDLVMFKMVELSVVFPFPKMFAFTRCPENIHSSSPRSGRRLSSAF